ncbi:hypothetical protein NSK_003478 [Nannochloropsis salina CCMP1776]|uniref:Uncharacterized protein n=1 Tax=Nannochloropsis salina CCMP1776 TaxID=1027361 RepID=A0A4D9D238_9STRA|nr:hypothetical protein NSK_003478 [Nannochloropsis salina CCMP1776]|eukprot:TFJ85054.1 hypothetical protein NSK_003478 [Nannochloropsis salina CCMP1776]
MLVRAFQGALRRRAILHNLRASGALASIPSRTLSGTPVTETDEYTMFPREGPGLDYKLNWSLNGDDVTPGGNAYRNLDAAALQQGAKGDKAPRSGADKVLEAGDSVPFETFDLHLADVKAALEKASDLYVEDGAVKGGSNFNIRVITDSASYALAAKALLDQSKVSGWPFEKAVNVYAAGGAKPFVGVMFAGGKEGNVTGATVAVGGAPATAIKNAVSLVAEGMKA